MRNTTIDEMDLTSSLSSDDDYYIEEISDGIEAEHLKEQDKKVQASLEE